MGPILLSFALALAVTPFVPNDNVDKWDTLVTVIKLMVCFCVLFLIFGYTG